VAVPEGSGCFTGWLSTDSVWIEDSAESCPATHVQSGERRLASGDQSKSSATAAKCWELVEDGRCAADSTSAMKMYAELEKGTAHGGELHM
jgi:hypothetical protein